MFKPNKVPICDCTLQRFQESITFIFCKINIIDSWKCTAEDSVLFHSHNKKKKEKKADSLSL